MVFHSPHPVFVHSLVRFFIRFFVRWILILLSLFLSLQAAAVEEAMKAVAASGNAESGSGIWGPANSLNDAAAMEMDPLLEELSDLTLDLTMEQNSIDLDSGRSRRRQEQEGGGGGGGGGGAEDEAEGGAAAAQEEEPKELKEDEPQGEEEASEESGEEAAEGEAASLDSAGGGLDESMAMLPFQEQVEMSLETEDDEIAAAG